MNRPVFSRRGFLALSGGAAALLAATDLAAAAPLASADTATSPYAAMLATWTQILTGGAIDPTDSVYAVSLNALNTNAQTYYTSMNLAGTSGLWSDLALGTSSAAMTASFNRILTVAESYATPGSAYQGDATVATNLGAALDWMIAHCYTTTQTEYANWWDWEIGSPQSLLNSAALLYGTLTSTRIANYAAATEHYIPTATTPLSGPQNTTGSNGTDLCQSVILRGVLTEDSTQIAAAVSALTKLAQNVHYADGLHPDGSFVFHGDRAYSGAYGSIWLDDIAKLATLLLGTSWALPASALQNVLDGVTLGYQPIVYNGLILDAVRGRSIAVSGGGDANGGINEASNVARLAGVASAAQAALFNSIAAGWVQRDTQRPLADTPTMSVAQVAQLNALMNDASVTPLAEPIDSHVFGDMDRAVHKRQSWAYALSMCSTRICRYEDIGGTNQQGWHTGDGMAYLYLADDPSQYTDQFWPAVDPYRLPGTTVDTATLADGYGSAYLTAGAWVGGAVLAGTYSAVGMNYFGYTNNLVAKKAWFCLDDCVVALGAGISATNTTTTTETIVENRNLGDPSTTTDPVLTVNGTTQADDLGTTQSFTGVHWASIDGVAGYVFLGSGSTINTLREDRTGAWSDINPGDTGGSFTRRYQTIWFDHGAGASNASYAYAILPGFTSSQTEARAGANTVQILSNTAQIQAIQESSLGLTAANFYAAGTIGPITVDAPCCVLISEADGTLQVAVSDPSCTSATVTVDLAISGYLDTATDSGVTILNVNGGVQILFEVGGTHGSTLTATLTESGTASSAGVTNLAPTADTYVQDGSDAATNYGTGTQLAVKNCETNNSGYDRIAYLQFDLAGLTGVQRAILWVYGSVSDGGGNQTQLQGFAVTSNSWTQSALTWNNQPTVGTALGTGWAANAADWIGLDVTSFIATEASAGTASLAVSQPATTLSTNLATFLNSTRAAAQQPYLEVITAP